MKKETKEINKENLIEIFENLREKGNPHDWIHIECLRNGDKFSKTDYTKEYVLWKAEDDGIEINSLENLKKNHKELYKLFVLDEKKKKVRFPFNTGDSELKKSLSPTTFIDYVAEKKLNDIKDSQQKLKEFKKIKKEIEKSFDFKKLKRWGTASRSCFVAVPFDPSDLEDTDKCVSQKRQVDGSDRSFFIPVNEFNEAIEGKGKSFAETIKEVISNNEVKIDKDKYKLYSLKTGVNYVGNHDERSFGKNVLEANSEFAMSRSQAINDAEKDPKAKDETFIIQKELLTITSGYGRADSRDGFQVRDLSEIDFENEVYLPAHAIPYTGDAFSKFTNSPEEDLEFWKRNFAYPCGRAKARFFLEYGLMQTSVNAQNFVIAFPKEDFDKGRSPEIKKFIMRDIGDSFWHDKYIEKVLGKKHSCFVTCEDELQKSADLESKGSQPISHTLETSSSESFYAPYMLKFNPGLIPNGHVFGGRMKEKRGWNNQQILEFGQEITNGFISYIREVGLLDLVLEKKGGNFESKKYDKSLKDVLKFGQKFEYGNTAFTGNTLKVAIEECRKDEEWSTFEAFNSIREAINKNLKELETININEDTKVKDSIEKKIFYAHTAEEVAICMAFENSLFNSKSKIATLQKSLKKGNRLPDVVNYPSR